MAKQLPISKFFGNGVFGNGVFGNWVFGNGVFGNWVWFHRPGKATQPSTETFLGMEAEY